MTVLSWHPQKFRLWAAAQQQQGNSLVSPARMSTQHAVEEAVRKPIRDVVDRVDNASTCVQGAVGGFNMAEAIAVGIALELVIKVIDALRNAKTNVRRAAWRRAGARAGRSAGLGRAPGAGAVWSVLLLAPRAALATAALARARAAHARRRGVCVRRSGRVWHKKALLLSFRLRKHISGSLVRH